MVISKNDFRKKYLALRRERAGDAGLSGLDRRSCEAAAERFFGLGEYRESCCIFFYWGCGGEVETGGMIRRALRDGKRVALPRVCPDRRMEFVEYTGGAEELRRGVFGIPEPVGEDVPSGIVPDLVVVPGVVFDIEGRRIGQGGGYYDVFLADLPCRVKKAALAFEWQIAASVPAEEHDVRVDMIITPKRIIVPKRMGQAGQRKVTGHEKLTEQEGAAENQGAMENRGERGESGVLEHSEVKQTGAVNSLGAAGPAEGPGQSSSGLNGEPPMEEPERQYYYIGLLKEVVAEASRRRGRRLKCCSVCFGCQMNERDSEKLLGILTGCGYEAVEDENAADLVIYNTCTVREHADKRIYGRLGVLKAHKDRNEEFMICLCGCMMQEGTAVEKIKKSYPFVDLIFGTHNLYRFAELLYAAMAGKRQVIDIWRESDIIVEGLPVRRKYPFKSGVNVMFGCNNFCSYCIVPYVRGRERSRGRNEILREMECLAADGVKEVMLLGQNVNSYGQTLPEGERVDFAGLLREVAGVEGIERIRFMSSHPKDLSDELIEAMAETPKVCRHIHLALQSGSDRVLERMNRHYTKEHYLSLVDKLRSAMEDIAITTDIIVGFPGEDDEDVEETIDCIERARFDGAFTFVYSIRSGTPAALMEQVDKELVRERFDRVLKKVQEVSKLQAERFTGRTMDVLVEQVNEKDSSMVTGRIGQNHVAHFPGSSELIGRIVRVKLEKCHGFYYTGRQEG